MKYFSLIFIAITSLTIFSCSDNTNDQKVRSIVDTVGFAKYERQMDSVVARIESEQGGYLKRDLTAAGIKPDDIWKAAISPHDDYTYASYSYLSAQRNIKAKILIIFGVAHKAKNFGLENQLVFESFDSWESPYGPVPVSKFRNEIFSSLPESMYTINDSMHIVEHSIEAIIPFHHHYNRNIEIVPVLVPYMPYERMLDIATPLADAIKGVMNKNGLEWGKDFAFIMSSDAVHYGDEGWGGKDFAEFGTDAEGYEAAVAKENEIISNCFSGSINHEKIKLFTEYTVSDTDYKDYKWTWCGRYSIPMGLLTAIELSRIIDSTTITGKPITYKTSIDNPPLYVDDIGMGTTAPATIRHWVGYASVAFY